MYRLFIEATMKCLSTNLTIVAILILLAVLLVRGIRGGSGGGSGVGVDFIDNRFEYSSHGQYDTIRITNVHNKCQTRRHRYTVRVRSECKVDVLTTKCVGYCAGGSNFVFRLPYWVKYRSCCNPREMSYQVKEFDCYKIQGGYKVNTGKKVKISIPMGMKCECSSSTGIRWLQSQNFILNYTGNPLN